MLVNFDLFNCAHICICINIQTTNKSDVNNTVRNKMCSY